MAAISEVFALQWIEERTEDSSQNDGKDDLESRRSPLERGHGKRRKCSSVGECEPSFPLSIDRNAPSEPSSAEPEFSSSVSFWWGRRILKK